MTQLVQILRSIVGRELGLDINDNLVIRGTKIYYGEQGNQSVWNIGSGGGGSGSLGTALAYAPAAGAVDPGSSVSGFGPTVGRVNVTLSNNTQLAGWPAGNDGQLLVFVVVAGGFTLQLTEGAVTAGSQFFNTGNPQIGLKVARFAYYDNSLSSWVII